MTELGTERYSSFLWVAKTVAVPVEVRQTMPSTIEVNFRDGQGANMIGSLRAGVIIEIDEDGILTVTYHGPNIDKTETVALGDMLVIENKDNDE